MSKQKGLSDSKLLRSYPKNIFCLESLWNTEVESKLTVLPLLELVSRINGIKYVHLSSNTLSEFEFNLKFLHRRPTYQILYLAFHGSSGHISFDDHDLSIEDLASILHGRFKNLTIHFGSCSTMNVDSKKLEQFTKDSGIRMLSGYAKNIDWVHSSAFEVLYFSALQEYKNTRYLISYLDKTYSDLIDCTGFRTFTS